jgi:hypothetical protein
VPPTIDGFLFPDLPSELDQETVTQWIRESRVSLEEWKKIEAQVKSEALARFGKRVTHGCVAPPGYAAYEFFTVRHGTNPHEVVKVRGDWQKMFVVFDT